MKTKIKTQCIMAISAITLFLGFSSCKKSTQEKSVTNEGTKMSSFAMKSNAFIGDAKEEKPGTFYGADISKWNGDEVKEIDETDSITFIICKATQGEKYIDPEFDKNLKTIRDKEKISGSYHFYSTDYDPVKQAQHYWNTINKFGKTDMPPVLDIEQGSISKRTKSSKSKLQKEVLQFLETTENQCGCIPMIYTGSAFANEYLTNAAFAKYPLWLAEYTKAKKPNVPSVWKGQGFMIWQRSESYDVDSHPTDFDVFYGSKSDLYAKKIAE